MRSRRPLRTAGSLALALALAGLAACGGDDSGGSGRDDPEGFVYEAARLCSDVLNDVDHEVAKAGDDARFAVVELAVRGDDVDGDLAAQYAEQLDAYRDELLGMRDRLASIQPDSDADRDAWDQVVASLDPKIDVLERRAGLLRDASTGGGALDPDAIQPGSGEPDHERLGAAVEQLGLQGRDCEVLNGQLGYPAERADFMTSAASACTTIVSRRRAAGFGTDHTLAAIKAIYDGGDLAVTPELQAEVAAVAAEWRLTVDDLDAVPSDGVPDPALWQDVLDAAAERVDVFERRAAALEHGDQAELVELFTPGGVYTHPGLGELADLGLDWRDCRSIEA